MSNEDRRNRSDRLKRRFEGSSREETEPEEEISELSKTTQTANTDKNARSAQSGGRAKLEAEQGSGSVKDRPSVLMYLPEEIHKELDIRFDELNAKYKRTHGEKLEKNRDYYPAVVKAGLESTDLEDILDL